MTTCTALIVAAGRGSRFGGPLPKQYANWEGQPVLRHTILALQASQVITDVRVVISPGGSQRVEWRDDSVYLTGWAEVLSEGEWFRELPR